MTRIQQRVACLLLKSSAPLLELAEACYRFSPQIAVRAHDADGTAAIFLEIGACRSLYNETMLLARLHVLAQRFGCIARVGFAEDAPTALASARYAGVKPAKFPLEAVHDYAAPFEPDNNTQKKVTDLIVKLRLLGLQTLGDFAKLPTKTLASRFGSLGVELSLRISQKATLAWPRFAAPEKVCEKAELHELSELPTCNTLEPLLFVLKGLIDRAMARLRGRTERAATIELVLDLERGKREWTIELPVPQGSAVGLLPILKERLSLDLNRAPLEHAIVRATFTVKETAPAHCAQRDLFEIGEAEAEAWDALVGRLRQKLGRNGAFIANPADEYLPEKAWIRALEALDRLPTEIPPRPARVLKKPQLCRQEGHYLVRSEPQKSAKRWRVIEWHGPERISVEWWMDPELQGFNRDYYRVVTEAGEQLWVFSARAREGYYLHGFFD